MSGPRDLDQAGRIDDPPPPPAAAAPSDEQVSAPGRPDPAAAGAAWQAHAAAPSAAVLEARLSGSGLAGAGASATGTAAVASPSVADRFGSWLGRRADDVRGAADGLRRAASDLEGQVERRVTDTFHAAADRATALGRDLEGAASDAYGRVRATAQGLVDAGESALGAARDAARSVEARGTQLASEARARLGRALETARSSAERIVAVGREVASSVANQLDARQQIGALAHEGDTVTYGLSASAQAEVRGEASGQVQVTRREEGGRPFYEVQVSGEAGLGVVGELGAHAGIASASAEANAMLRAGGAVTLRFDSPDEAARAVQIVARQAGQAAIAATPGVGTVAAPLIAPSADDMQFMASHATGIDLSGGLSGQDGGSLGVGLDRRGHAQLAGIGADLGAGARMGMHLDFPRAGQPARLTVYAEGTLQGGANAGFGLRVGEGEDARGGRLGVGANAEGQLRARIEQRFDLPRGVDLAALERDPAGTLASIRDEVLRTAETRVTLSGEGAARATGAGGAGAGFEVTLRGRTEELGRAVSRFAQGDVQGGLRGLGRDVEVEAKTERARTTGFRIAPEISAFGVGVGVGVVAERTNRQPIAQYRGRAGETADWLARQLGQVDPRMAAAGPR
jgi:hypothetical protein